MGIGIPLLEGDLFCMEIRIPLWVLSLQWPDTMLEKHQEKTIAGSMALLPVLKPWLQFCPMWRLHGIACQLCNVPETGLRGPSPRIELGLVAWPCYQYEALVTILPLVEATCIWPVM